MMLSISRPLLYRNHKRNSEAPRHHSPMVNKKKREKNKHLLLVYHIKYRYNYIYIIVFCKRCYRKSYINIAIIWTSIFLQDLLLFLLLVELFRPLYVIAYDTLSLMRSKGKKKVSIHFRLCCKLTYTSRHVPFSLDAYLIL